MKVPASKHIELALTYVGKTESWLAHEIGTTPQNFNNKKKRNSFSEQELIKIAQALGAEYEMSFNFPDGTKL